jgi:cell division septation protein DedD
MKFLLVLSDAFDALRAHRARVALALTGIAIAGVLAGVYLARTDGKRAASRPVVAHNTSAAGRVEPARPVPAPSPKPAPAVSSGADVPAAAPTATQSPAPRIAQVPADTSAPSLSYRVQVGAFREPALARGLSRRLAQAGFPALLDQGKTSDGTPIYRVRTKQALPKDEALELLARLRKREPALRPFLVEDPKGR